jgi:hypothetical protein
MYILSPETRVLMKATKESVPTLYVDIAQHVT